MVPKVSTGDKILNYDVSVEIYRHGLGIALTTFRGVSLMLFSIAIADLAMGDVIEGAEILTATYVLAYLAEGCVYLLDESISNPNLKIT